MTPDEKECPVCGETIKAIAKKCKHCGEWLNADDPPGTVPPALVSSGPPPAVAAPSLDGLKGAQVLDLLSTLVDKNLVVYEEDQNGQGRYRLLETVRQYAQERLAAQSVEEEQGVSGRHQDYFLVLAEQEQHRLHGPEQIAALERLEREHDNFRATLERCRKTGSTNAGLRLSGALFWFWNMHSHLKEGRAWLEEMLARQETPGPTRERALAMQGAGQICFYLGDYPAAIAWLERSAASWRELGDQPSHAYALVYLIYPVQASGDPARARALTEECVARARQAADPWVLAMALWARGTFLHFQGEDAMSAPILEESIRRFRIVGDRWGLMAPLAYLAQIRRDAGRFAEARALSEEALECVRRTGHTWRILACLSDLGEILFWQGDLTGARARLEQSLALCRETDDPDWAAKALCRLGHVARREAKPNEARAHYRESLQIVQGRASTDPARLFHILTGLAWVALAEEKPARAVRLLGMAEAVCPAERIKLPNHERADGKRVLASAHAALGAETFATAWSEGKAMPLEQAVAYALEEEPSP
jgi:tetratricopeptide (TPR) repeat protein